jgi:hypothetical protein
VVKTLIARGGPAALIFENLAERTLAFAQIAKKRDPGQGYEPLLEMELGPVLKDCLSHGITIIGNFGAANPLGAARHIQKMAQAMGLAPPRIAVVTGDDLSGSDGLDILEKAFGGTLDRARFVSANAYQGAFPIAQAIREGAQIVVTGRVADPSLTLGPAIAHFGWSEDNWDALAGGTMAGHLLECGSQVTGGYFGDPDLKEVPDLANVGFPIAEILNDGSCIITKADNTGGLVDRRTVTEQLLYEIHDPAAYITPDVVADMSAAELEQVGPNAVRLSGVQGHPRPATLKTNVYFDGGWLGEGEISYAGHNAEKRARWSMAILRERMKQVMPLRFDLIGVLSIVADDAGQMLEQAPSGDAADVRLRVAGRHDDVDVIERMLREVNGLYTNGPAGGGGVRLNKRRRLAMKTCMVPRELAPAQHAFIDIQGALQ